MQEAYNEYNEHAEASGNSHGHFMVDLCRPGHMTACLRTFQVSHLVCPRHVMSARLL
jgi:hypothetical protein